MFDIYQHMNCMQMCLKLIYDKYSIPDYLMFCNGWDFCYSKNRNLSNSIFISNEENSFLKKHSGLNVEVIPSNLFPQKIILYFLSNYINNKKDIIIHIDSFYCPWHRAYQKETIQHHIYVSKIDISRRILICDDPYFNVFSSQLSFENFNYGCKEIYVYDKQRDSEGIDASYLLKLLSKKTNINQIVSNVRSFANDLITIKNPNDLFDAIEDVYLCSNVRNLKFIADSRYGLSYVFLCLYKEDRNNNELLHLSELFESIARKFENINNSYIKLYYRNKDYMGKLYSIKEKLVDISNLEIEIYNQISNMERYYDHTRKII